MRFSTRTRYGLRALLELALAYNKGPVQTQLIAEKQDISKKYLNSIFITLRANGIVKSIRGPGGGFILAAPPSEISVYKVIHVLEGEIDFSGCIENPNVCPRVNFCVTREVWKRLGDITINFLSNITLESLIIRKEEKEKFEASSFYI